MTRGTGAAAGSVAARGHVAALIVPDAGPLITFGKADLLHLLLAPDLPVWLVDQVAHEVTQDRSHADAVAIAAFIAKHGAQVHVFQTEVGRFASEQRAAGLAGRQRGLGEAAIAEFLQRLDEVAGDPLTPAILLFEDNDVRSGRFRPGPNTHLVSTWSFLKGLEDMGLLQSAEAAWSAIEASGRKLRKHDVDLPASPDGAPWRR